MSRIKLTISYMSIINNLKEDLYRTYEAEYEYRNVKYPIYSNPSIQEMEKCYVLDSIRFIADGKKKMLYVFSSEILHIDAGETLNIDYFANSPYYYFGVGGKLKGNKISKIENMKIEILIDNEELEPKSAKVNISLLAKNWDWLNPWIDIKYFNKYNQNLINEILPFA